MTTVNHSHLRKKELWKNKFSYFNLDSDLMRIVKEYSSNKPKHFLIIYNSKEKIGGLKQEQAFLQSVASHFKRTDKATVLAKHNLSVTEINKILEQIKDEQLIVLFSGHGQSGMLRISESERFNVGDFPNNTILFTSSPKIFQRYNMKVHRQTLKQKEFETLNNKRNITIIGERNGFTHPSHPGRLHGVYFQLNLPVGTIKDEEKWYTIKQF